MADGHVNKCKVCNKADVRNNRQDNLEYYQQYDRERSREKNSQRYFSKLEYSRNLPEEVKKNKALLLKERDKEFPEKKKANSKVTNAIRDGKLFRPSCCECCGKECKPQAHHSSYSEDMWLLVTWLCTSCHGEVHRKYE